MWHVPIVPPPGVRRAPTAPHSPPWRGGVAETERGGPGRVPARRRAPAAGRHNGVMEPIISAAGLAAELSGAGEPPVLIDVRYRMGGPPGHGEYAKGHIAGARYVD